MIPQLTDFWVVSLWWYHELMVFYWRFQAQARAGGILLVVSYWWNHNIRGLLVRDASPCSVNPNLVARHELLHTIVSHPWFTDPKSLSPQDQVPRLWIFHWGLPARCASGGSAPLRSICSVVRIARGDLPRPRSQNKKVVDPIPASRVHGVTA